MAQSTMMMHAYEVGILVTLIHGDMYATCPLLAAPCVRVSDEGLIDLTQRMRTHVDKRPAYDRARDAAMHLRLTSLMKAHRPFASECAMLMYNPKQRIVRDLRIAHRYTEAARVAERVYAQQG